MSFDQMTYNKAHRAEINARKREKYKTDPVYRAKCYAERKAWALANPEHAKRTFQTWAARNKDKLKAKAAHRQEQIRNFPEAKLKISRQMKVYYANNADERRQAAKLYAKQHRGVCTARSRRYQLEKEQRCPAWLDTVDHSIIVALYNTAQQMTLVTGERWHVDHIIPLRGKKVSGLHVPLNLHLVTAAANNRKSNYFEIL